jgi:hypothetical protein
MANISEITSVSGGVPVKPPPKLVSFDTWLNYTFGANAWQTFNKNVKRSQLALTPEYAAFQQYLKDWDEKNAAYNEYTQFQNQNPSGTFLPQKNTYTPPVAPVVNPTVTPVAPIVDPEKPLDVWAGYGVDNIGQHYYDDLATGQRTYYILGTDGKPMASHTVPLIQQGGGSGLSAAEQLAWERQKLADSLGSTERQNDLDRQLRQQELNIQQGANIASAELERKKWLAQLGASPQDFIEYSKQAYGKLPETPTWLAKFSPALQAGQTIQPLALGSPSAQWYNRAAPTQKGMLQGYTNWSAAQGQGGVWEDQLATMKNMLPTEQPYPINNWRPTWTGR